MFDGSSSSSSGGSGGAGAAVKSRRGAYKQGLDMAAGRRRRDTAGVQLRKAKKDEALMRKRMALLETCDMSSSSSSTSTELAPFGTGAAEGQQQGCGFEDLLQDGRRPRVADLPRIAEAMTATPSTAGDHRAHTIGCRSLRKILSVEKNPPVREVLDFGEGVLLGVLVQFLGAAESAELQFEAAWALTNVASTEFSQAVADAGAIGPLAEQLRNAEPNVREQSAWCLGNIAGDCTALRDAVLTTPGAVEGLLLNVEHHANLSLLRNVTWTLSNLCRSKPQPRLDLLLPILPYLVRLCTFGDQEVQTDALWALSYVSDGDDVRIQSVVDTEVVPSLVALLGSGDRSLITPALRTLGNIVSGNEEQTQAVVDAQCLGHMAGLLRHERKGIRKESCWMLSNICAGTHGQISAVLSTPALLPAILQQMSNSEWDVRKEAAWAITNVVTGGSEHHVSCLVDHGAIRPLCDILSVSDADILTISLEAIDRILQIGAQTNAAYDRLVMDTEGVEKIESLQEHSNETIYLKALGIIENFFGGEEEENENVAPQVAAGNQTFQFGLTTLQAGVQQQQQEQPTAGVAKSVFLSPTNQASKATTGAFGAALGGAAVAPQAALPPAPTQQQQKFSFGGFSAGLTSSGSSSGSAAPPAPAFGQGSQMQSSTTLQFGFGA